MRDQLARRLYVTYHAFGPLVGDRRPWGILAVGEQNDWLRVGDAAIDATASETAVIMRGTYSERFSRVEQDNGQTMPVRGWAEHDAESLAVMDGKKVDVVVRKVIFHE
jgi:hypothetical protein